jgi:hypothetical protein
MAVGVLHVSDNPGVWGSSRRGFSSGRRESAVIRSGIDSNISVDLGSSRGNWSNFTSGVVCCGAFK